MFSCQIQWLYVVGSSWGSSQGRWGIQIETATARGWSLLEALYALCQKQRHVTMLERGS